MFTQPAFDVIRGPKALRAGKGSFGRWKSRVRGLPEFGGELPVAALAEEILEEGDDRVRALFTSAGNPVLSTPNGRQLDRALASLEFMVSLDPYLNETTRHARIILPPASALEREHYDVAFHVYAVRNTAKYSLPVFEKPRGALHDWEIFHELAHRLSVLRDGKSAKKRAQYEVLRRMGPSGIIALGLRFGPYGAKANPLKRGLSLRALESSPHGVDLGPLEPCLLQRLSTRDRRLHLAPPELVKDLARLRATFPPEPTTDQGSSLLLIGRRHLRDNNSWLHNVPKLMAGKPRCTLMLHPDDAKARGLDNGALAEVRSRVGEVVVPVEIDEDIMQGVVSLPHGYGHAREGVIQRVATSHPGVSINDLTDEQAIDPVTGNAAFSGVQVEVRTARASRVE